MLPAGKKENCHEPASSDSALPRYDDQADMWPGRGQMVRPWRRGGDRVDRGASWATVIEELNTRKMVHQSLVPVSHLNVVRNEPALRRPTRPPAKVVALGLKIGSPRLCTPSWFRYRAGRVAKTDAAKRSIEQRTFGELSA